jgi:cytoskeletal protein CcmA (bactofilin family)
MLKKKPLEEMEGFKSILAEGLRIEGNIRAEGKIKIDGEVNGDIAGDCIILGQASHIKGNVRADIVVVMGNVEGNIDAETLEIKSSARLKGDMCAEKLSVEPGASLEGTVKVGSYREKASVTISTTFSSEEQE